ncbi:glucokinase [Marinomonas sp. C2222]|uniref:Glucokinase n=1 Tax=Marinomonas sargassi TaxID=2984494 RepID=A0ABT2YNT3_9GAMM|nr:glucokinase [Marinomonas sargassi]MCV2401545.1 glucokinase [Marinomonas sargassi]
MSYALIADLGGTNARFALAPIHKNDLFEVKVYPCKDYLDLFSAVTEYLNQSSVDFEQVSAVVFAIAGPVNQPVIRFTNNNWQFTHEDVENFFGKEKKIALINDYDALGHSLDALPKSELAAVGDSSKLDLNAPRWVIGPGTGLGVSCVVPQKEGANIILPGEGGHVDLSPCNDLEDDIVKFLRKKYQRVSAEHVLSGRGLENLYEALALREGVEKRITAPQIGKAVSSGDPIAVAALNQFFVFLGRVVGDLVLSVESRGGVYITGGIVPRYIEEIRKSDFRDAMQDKGPMKGLVSPIPTFVVMSEYPGLIGCACYASYLVSNT